MRQLFAILTLFAAMLSTPLLAQSQGKPPPAKPNPPSGARPGISTGPGTGYATAGNVLTGTGLAVGELTAAQVGGLMVLGVVLGDDETGTTTTSTGF